MGRDQFRVADVVLQPTLATQNDVGGEMNSRSPDRRAVSSCRRDGALDSFVGWFGAVPNADRSEFEVGYRLRRDAWGKGLATEGTSALIDLVFTLGARRVFAQTMAVNERSRRVMERCGLRHERTFHLCFDDPLPGTERCEVEYAMTRAAWRRR